MIAERYYYKPVGQDCWGNISGYCVYDENHNPVQLFTGNIYREGSFEQAEADAKELAKQLTIAAIKERRGIA